MTKVPIGIAGYLHSGKDTLADCLLRFRPTEFYKYSFAEPMKKLAMDIFGFTANQMYDPEIKEEMDEFWEITPRKFLQLLGTDMFRDKFREDVWLKFAEKRMWETPDQYMMVPDVRFDNEAKFIRDRGGWVIQIVRDDAGHKESRKHASENGVNDDYINYTIHNNGSLESLERVALQLCHYLTSEDFDPNKKWIPANIKE